MNHSEFCVSDDDFESSTNDSDMNNDGDAAQCRYNRNW